MTTRRPYQREEFSPPKQNPANCSVGTKEKGEDGHAWEVVKSQTGSLRWLPVGNLARGLYVRRESAKNRKPRTPAPAPRPLSDPSLLWVRKNPKKLKMMVDGGSFQLATTREGLLRQLRVFVEGWGEITTRNQDMPEERMAEESTEEIRSHVKVYASEKMRAILAGWLAHLLKKAVR